MDERDRQGLVWLFTQVYRLPPEGRAAWLERECPDPNRRALILDLVEAADGDPLIAELLRDTPEADEPVGLAVPPDLGPYPFLSRVGRGGMGEVWRSYDRSLDIEVAVKLLAPEVASDALRMEMLRREAKLLAALNHPNIARIYRIEEHGDRIGIVMEWIEGRTLSADLRERGAIPWPQAVRCAMALADALAYAHARDVVHCDLKPANIMVARDQTVKILDFGIARMKPSAAVPEGVESPPTPTLAGTTLFGAAMHRAGTPGYMSPEQYRGEAPDPRSDIWALGVLLYELLTGVAAFPMPTFSVLPAGTLPERRPLRPGRGIPGSLARLIERMTAESPALRPATMPVVKVELEQLLRPWYRRKRERALVLVLATLLGIGAWQALLEWEWLNLESAVVRNHDVFVRSPLREHRLRRPKCAKDGFHQAVLFTPASADAPLVVAGGAVNPRTGVSHLVAWDRFRVVDTSISSLGRPALVGDDVVDATHSPNEWNKLSALPSPDRALCLVALAEANHYPGRCLILDAAPRGAKGPRLRERYRLEHAGHVADVRWTGPPDAGLGLLWLIGSVPDVVADLVDGRHGNTYFVAVLPDQVRGQARWLSSLEHDVAPEEPPWLYFIFRPYEVVTHDGHEALAQQNSIPMEFSTRSIDPGPKQEDRVLLSNTMTCTLHRDELPWRVDWSVSGDLARYLTSRALSNHHDPGTEVRAFLDDSVVVVARTASGLPIDRSSPELRAELSNH